MSLRNTFGENVKFHRKRIGLSQQQFAELCNIVPNYVSEIENGKKFPSVELIEKIATVLKVAPYVFFMDSSELQSGPIPNEDILIKKRNADFSEALLKSVQELLTHYGFV